MNYQVSAEQLTEIQHLQEKGEIQVSSLHNIVPLPEGADPDTAHRLYPFTSPNLEVRKKGVELTKKTIDQAARLDAAAVVLHSGESWDAPLVEMEMSYVNTKLKSRQSKEKLDAMKAKLIKLRKTYSPKALDRILECLRELVPYAQGKGVKLGLENRYWYAQFPNVEELEILLTEFKTTSVGLWFDVGHAATQEYLGFQSKYEVLQKFSERLIGIHLMDCLRNSDHLAPGKGQVDFGYLSKVLKPEVAKVLELALHVPADEIREGVTVLRKYGIG